MCFAAIYIAFVLDLIFGDPSIYPHPVRCIGLFVNLYEKVARKIFSFNLYLAGFVSVVFVLLTTFLILLLIFGLVSFFPPEISYLIAIFLIYTSISYKDLKKESVAVYLPLVNRENLKRARTRLSRIVGRDTENLDREGVVKAAVETVAENSSDGVIAPLFWAILASMVANYFGSVEIVWAAYGAIIYKAINTMDSMLGYKNEKYLQFGLMAAKLDDLANYLPARLTGVGIIIASFVIRINYKNSYRILKRDCRNHLSPNAGFPEAAVAGALDIQLCGPTTYFGKIYNKPYIGEKGREIQASDILTVNRLNLVSSIILLTLMLLVKFLIQMVW